MLTKDQAQHTILPSTAPDCCNGPLLENMGLSDAIGEGVPMSTRQSLFTLSVACLLLVRSALLAQSGDKRHPVPDAPALKKAEATIRDVFEAEYAKKEPKDRVAFAKKLLQTGLETKTDLAARYVLLREAAEIAAAAGDIQTAIQAVAEMAKSYDIDELLTRGTTLASAASSTSDSLILKSIIEAFLRLADDGVSSDHYDVALRAAKAAERYARKAKDFALVADAKAKLKDVQVLRAEFDKVAKALQTLAQNPGDPDANLAVGQFVCLVKGNWEEGLPLLAKGSDPNLKSLAAADLAGPKDASEQVKLADEWRDLADKETNKLKKNNLLAREACWYEAALPNLTGLAKAKIEKQLEDIENALAGVERGFRPGRGKVSRDQLIAARKAGVPPVIELKLGRGVKMKMVYIPPGTFLMGSPEGEGYPDEHPQHPVRITRGFYMGVTEVTQAHWKAVMGTEPWKDNSRAGKSPNAAANCISWDDAVEFCKRLSAKTHRPFRLPTEAQWEYACRAGTTTRHFFGDDPAKLGDYAWYIVNTMNVDRNYPQEVGQKKPNRWGLYDMHGNVWEWCLDSYSPTYHSGSPRVDPENRPAGVVEGVARVARGDGWQGDAPGGARSAFRARVVGPTPGTGIRVVAVPR